MTWKGLPERKYEALPGLMGKTGADLISGHSAKATLMAINRYKFGFPSLQKSKIVINEKPRNFPCFQLHGFTLIYLAI